MENGEASAKKQEKNPHTHENANIGDNKMPLSKKRMREYMREYRQSQRQLKQALKADTESMRKLTTIPKAYKLIFGTNPPKKKKRKR